MIRADMPPMPKLPAIFDVIKERARQIELWGQQDHDLPNWMVILMEEVGEAAKEVWDGNRNRARTELIQVAAVAVAIVEAMDRTEEKKND